MKITATALITTVPLSSEDTITVMAALSINPYTVSRPTPKARCPAHEPPTNSEKPARRSWVVDANSRYMATTTAGSRDALDDPSLLLETLDDCPTIVVDE